MNDLRPCAECGEMFSGRHEHRNYAQRFCSRECAKLSVTERKRAHWPPEDEMRRLVNVEKLSDAQIGKRYGHSYEWARRVRNFYGIRAVPKPPHRTVKHGRYNGRGGWTVKKKGEECCRACGHRPTGSGPFGALHLHHVIPRSMCKVAQTDLRNGIALCFACHQGWHDRSVTVYRDVFTREEWEFLIAVDLLGQEVLPWLEQHYPVREVLEMAA